jgi:outer membrane protein assembly factor BamB
LSATPVVANGVMFVTAAPGVEPAGKMVMQAIDACTGQVRWATPLDQIDYHAYVRIGGPIFGGYEQRFVILNSDTGEMPWLFLDGGLTNAGAVSNSVYGVQ